MSRRTSIAKPRLGESTHLPQLYHILGIEAAGFCLDYEDTLYSMGTRPPLAYRHDPYELAIVMTSKDFCVLRMLLHCMKA